MRAGAEARFWCKVQLCEHVDGRVTEQYFVCNQCCWPWLGTCDAEGYGRTCYVFDDGEVFYAHRAAWAFSHHGIVPEHEVTHEGCDNPPCCNPSHILHATHAHNQASMARKGRAHNGGRRVHKLGWDAAQRIHSLSVDGLSQREIARVMQCSQPMVCKVLRGAAWPSTQANK